MSNFLLAMSCAIPALASFVFYSKIGVTYKPFLFTLWLAVSVELLMKIFEHNYFAKATTANIFFILNLLLFLWLFYLNKVFSQKMLFTLFIISLLLHGGEWWMEHRWLIWMKSSVFGMAIITAGCIKMITPLLIDDRESLFKSFRFIVLVATIINCSFYILNVALAWSLPLEDILLNRVALIYYVVNALTYLLIFYGILCLKWKKS